MLLILTSDNRCLNEIHTIIVGWIDIWTNKKPIKTPLAISQYVLKNAKIVLQRMYYLLGNLWPQRLGSWKIFLHSSGLIWNKIFLKMLITRVSIVVVVVVLLSFSWIRHCFQQWIQQTTTMRFLYFKFLQKSWFFQKLYKIYDFYEHRNDFLKIFIQNYVILNHWKKC